MGTGSTVVGVFAGAAAANTTLQAGDTITGAGTGNTLKVVDTDAVGGVGNVLAGVTVSGIQSLLVTGLSAAANTYNLTAYTGFNNVTSLNSSQTVNFTGLAAGSSITVSGAATTAAAVNGTYTVATSTPTINLVGGVTGVTVTAVGGTATSAVINSSGGTNGTTAAGLAAANTVSFGAGGNINTLTVNASSNTVTTLTAADFVAAGAALTVSGAASSVDLGTNGVYKTINASGLTSGGVTVNASTTLTSFTGGGGNDVLTNNAAGNAAIAASATINAGAGVDTVSATLVNAGNAAAFTGFEVLALGGAAGVAATFDASLLTGSVLTGVSYDAALGGPLSVSNLVENSNGFNVSLAVSAGANTTLAFTAGSVTGTTDKVNYVFNEVAGVGAINAGTITQSNIEQVTIVSGGVAGTTNTIAITDTALQTVTITGNRDLVYQTTAQTQYSTTVATQLTSINGSAATGNLTITDLGAAGGVVSKAAVTIVGGSGNDTINVITSAAGTAAGASTGFGGDTVTTGAGADTVNASAALTRSATSPGFTTITDLAVGDSLVGLAAASWTATAADVSAATSLVTAANLAVVDGAASWFVYAGNTYVMFDDGTAAGLLGTADVLVKLTGVRDLSTAVFDGVDTITL